MLLTFLFRIQKRFMTQRSPQMVLQALANNKKDKLLYTPDPKTGDTVLHKAAALSRSVFETQVNVVGIEAAAAMAKITSHQGKLPLHIAKEEESLEKMPIISKLYELMKANNVKSLHESINTDMVLSRYSSTTVHPKLHQNLEKACIVANKVRALKLESCTHPSIHHWDIIKLKKTDDKIQEISAHVEKIQQQNRKTYAAASHEQRQYALLETRATIAMQFKLANCYEISMVGLWILTQMFNSLPGEVYTIGNGNHVFMILDRDRKKSAIDYTTWQNDPTVALDIHKGEVYSASEIPMRLTNSYNEGYRCGNHISHVHAATSFNPHFHGIHPIFSLYRDSDIKFCAESEATDQQVIAKRQL